MSLNTYGGCISFTYCDVQLYRYLVSQESVVPVKAMTDTLAKHFPQYKFAQGKDAEVKKVINNSKV